MCCKSSGSICVKLREAFKTSTNQSKGKSDAREQAKEIN